MQQQSQCPVCGAPVSYGMQYCPVCNTQFTWPVQQQSPPPRIYQPPEQINQKQNNSPAMNWFQSHLNWTWLFIYLLWFIINYYADDAFGLMWWFSLATAIFVIVVSVWVIKQKRRSLWWILLMPVFSPLWLSNHNNIIQTSPMNYEERQKCIAYYRDEKKLCLLFERMELFFQTRINKYEDAYFEARKSLGNFLAGKSRSDDCKPVPPMEIMDKILVIRGANAEASKEIVRRKNIMRIFPPMASSMSSAYLDAYLAYEALRDINNIPAGYDAMQVAIKQTREKELLKNYQKFIQKARKEEMEFCKRIQLTNSEYQEILDFANTYIYTDEWFKQLTERCL